MITFLKPWVWDDAAVETIRALRQDGYSASEIARKIDPVHRRVSRNAVIGKLHRLGLSGGGKPSRPGVRKVRIVSEAARLANKANRAKGVLAQTLKPTTYRRGGARALPPQAPTEPKPVVLENLTFARPWEERRAGQCAWPIGERGAILSCCAPTTGVYCDHHKSRMFVSGSKMDKKMERHLLKKAA